MKLPLVYIVLVWMASLVPSAPYKASFLRTAAAIADACEGEIRCAAVLVAIGFYESSFNPDAVGDNGQSVGIWQLSRAWAPGQDVESHAPRARELVLRSFRICRDRPLDERLGWYAAGGDGCVGRKASRIRMALARHLMGGGT